MKDLDWGAIGAIGTLLGIIVAIIQNYKKETPNNDNSINQNVKGTFFSGNDISQKIEKKD